MGREGESAEAPDGVRSKLDIFTAIRLEGDRAVFSRIQPFLSNSPVSDPEGNMAPVRLPLLFSSQSLNSEHFKVHKLAFMAFTVTFSDDTFVQLCFPCVLAGADVLALALAALSPVSHLLFSQRNCCLYPAGGAGASLSALFLLCLIDGLTLTSLSVGIHCQYLCFCPD